MAADLEARRRKRRRQSSPQYNEAEFLAKLIPARDLDPISSLLVYARNKVGKTTLAGSASKLGKTLLIDCEKGATSIREKYPDVSVYKLTEYDQIDEIYWFLANKKHGYKYVIIDPVTRLGHHCMVKVLEEDAKMAQDGDPMKPTQAAYGKTAQLMRDALMRYKNLPGIFLIVTAYEKRRETDDEDSDFDYVIGPDAQPAVKGFLMGQMDIIGRLYVKQLESEDIDQPGKIERRMLFGSHEIYESGDRSDRLPRIMRLPTMAKIIRDISKRSEE